MRKRGFKSVLFTVFLVFNCYGICPANGLVVGDNGYVGIGIENPGVRLANIAGTGKDISTDGIYWNAPGNGKYVAQFRNGSAAPYGLSVRLGVSAPGSNHHYLDFLDDEGVIQATFAGTGESNGGLSIGVSGIQRLVINEAGNMGIGTAAPSYKLDVNGIIRGSNVSPSDVRWKTNISTIENALEKIAQLRGVTYEWADPSKGAGEQIGVIAQEVEDTFPQVVSMDNEGYRSVAYAKLAAPMIEAIKELRNENAVLRRELSELREAVQKLAREREAQ